MKRSKYRYSYKNIRYFFKRQYRYIESAYRKEELRSAHRRLNVRKSRERDANKNMRKYWSRKGIRYIDIYLERCNPEKM